MKTITVSYYEVYESYDRDTHVIAKFANFADAKKLADTSPYYGVHNTPVEKSFTIFESYSEFEDWKKDEPRRKALSKLTAADRKILGLE